jgi:hypothetical protein
MGFGLRLAVGTNFMKTIEAKRFPRIIESEIVVCQSAFKFDPASDGWKKLARQNRIAPV